MLRPSGWSASTSTSAPEPAEDLGCHAVGRAVGAVQQDAPCRSDRAARSGCAARAGSPRARRGAGAPARSAHADGPTALHLPPRSRCSSSSRSLKPSAANNLMPLSSIWVVRGGDDRGELQADGGGPAAARPESAARRRAARRHRRRSRRPRSQPRACRPTRACHARSGLRALRLIAAARRSRVKRERQLSGQEVAGPAANAIGAEQLPGHVHASRSAAWWRREATSASRTAAACAPS